MVTPAFETYLHRIGRSGRFGRRGAAFNLVTGPAVSSTGFLLLPWERNSVCRRPRALSLLLSALVLCRR